MKKLALLVLVAFAASVVACSQAGAPKKEGLDKPTPPAPTAPVAPTTPPPPAPPAAPAQPSGN